MPPTEENSLPRIVERPIHYSKAVDKVLEVPIVSETMSSVLKITSNIGEQPQIKQAAEVVTGGLKRISNNTSVQKFANNETVIQAVNSVRARLEPAMTNLDQAASEKLDQMQNTYPALNMKPSELLEASKETAYTKVNRMLEFIASYTIIQIMLRMSEKFLMILQTNLHKRSVLPSVEARTRHVRRYLRFLRRAGEKIANEARDNGQLSLLDKLLDRFGINKILDIAGIGLNRISIKRRGDEDKASKSAKDKSEKDQEDRNESEKDKEDRDEVMEEYPEEEGGLEALKGDLSGYESDEDPDYVPPKDAEEIDTSSSEVSGQEDNVEDEEKYEKADVDENRSERENSVDEIDRLPESDRTPDSSPSQGLQQTAVQKSPKPTVQKSPKPIVQKSSKQTEESPATVISSSSISPNKFKIKT